MVKAVEPSTSHPQATATSNQLTKQLPAQDIQQGRQYYATAQYESAIQVWQQATQYFATQRNVLSQASVLSYIALAYQQIGNVSEADIAISASQQLLNDDGLQNQSNYWSVLGQTLTNQGNLQLLRSQPANALNAFQQAMTAYTTANNIDGILRSKLNQTQALQALGFYRRALTNLTDLEPLLIEQASPLLRAATFRQMGELFRITGDIDQAQHVLQASLDIVEKLDAPAELAQTWLSLGRIAQAQGHSDQALDYYQQVIAFAVSPTLTLKASVVRLTLRFETGQADVTDSELADIQNQLTHLPISRTSVYAQLDLVRSLLDFSHQGLSSTIPSLLQQTLDQSKKLGDSRAESYALGYLGEYSMQAQSLSDAQSYLEQALKIAQTIQADDIAYRWQWQLGRLLAQQGTLDMAIATYSNAVKSLQTLRNELVAINPDIQYDFREKVEPVYRELVNLLLTPSSETSEISQTNLFQAREAIELLQLAELENFFREPCLSVQQQIDQLVDATTNPTAVLYPIILPDRLDLILKLPNKPLQHRSTPVSQADLDARAEELINKIVLPYNYTLKEAQAISEQLYDWLLKPVDTALAEANIETLVFVLDGTLRNIPMAVLYDGQNYLVEKYNLALAPGLNLVDPQPLTEQRLAAIAAGLTESRHGFSPLESVRTEIERIQMNLTGQILLDQSFTQAALEKEINDTPFPIVHLATHGQFSSDPEETFILAWDTPIKINTLNRILRNSEQTRQDAIELLVLSACETASGDKRAALGLAGVAVQAGARSTLASLWNLDDETGALFMEKFYQILSQQNTTKANVLRQVQLALIQNPDTQHPRYWAPYVLVGNWL
ncbi:CHAT domain-containing protein [Leptothoe spongobia]|nr:CHAT domain-containing protein [Leptothoe spongobia]